MVNRILGGGGNSRLWQRVREKEGLSYGVRSSFSASALTPSANCPSAPSSTVIEQRGVQLPAGGEEQESRNPPVAALHELTVAEPNERLARLPLLQVRCLGYVDGFGEAFQAQCVQDEHVRLALMRPVTRQRTPPPSRRASREYN